MERILKTALLIGLLTVCPLTDVSGQDIDIPTDSLVVDISVGTTTSFTGVAFDIDVSKMLPANVRIDRAGFAGNRNSMPDFSLRSDGRVGEIVLDKNIIAATVRRIQAVINGDALREDIMDILTGGGLFIHISGDLRIPLDNGAMMILRPETLRQASIPALSDQALRRLTAALGGDFALYQNKIDFGMQADTADSTRRIFSATFRYYDRPFSSMPWWMVHARGYLSTDSNDSLSEVSIYPLTVSRLRGLDGPWPTELRGSLGIEGDQRFRRSRLNANGYLSTLTPNLIDLTGGVPRLRLKPVIRVGFEYWHEFDDHGHPLGNKKGGKIGGELYYVIPVLKNYMLLIEGEVGAPLGAGFKQKYRTGDLIKRFDMTLGYNIPGGGLQIMAKYSFGKTDVLFREDSKLFIGILLDFLQGLPAPQNP